MTTKITVAIIGFSPEHADLALFPDLTPEKVLAGMDATVEELRAQGFEAGTCLISADPSAAEAKVKAHLAQHSPGIVVIGAGVRTDPKQLFLFERLINLVHRHAPEARICFNTRPTDTVQAVQRWAQG